MLDSKAGLPGSAAIGRTGLAELREQVADLVGPIDPPHPDADVLGNLRVLARD